MTHTIATVMLFGLIYLLGRWRGRRSAIRHCQDIFVSELSIYKRALDDSLRRLMFPGVSEVSIFANGTTLFTGSSQDAAKKSLELGELIEAINSVSPKQVT